MLISEIMNPGILTAQASDSIRKVAQLMRDNDIGAVPIYENKKPAGFTTDRDIVIACADEELTLEDTIANAMSPEFIAVSQEKDVTEAARIMEENQISRLLVVNENQEVVGMVTLADLSLNLENPHLKAELMDEIKH